MGKKFLLISIGAKEGSVLQRYCKRWPNHCYPHGLRKCGSTYTTSGTTVPPPLTPIFMRGEWSMSVVQDVYWLYCRIGDQHLGQVMTGLDPNTGTFDTLPPHFVVGLDDEHVQKVFAGCINNIITSLEGKDIANITGLLMRCLTSIVHHSSELKK